MTAKPFCDGPFSTLKGTSWIVGKDHHGEPCHVLDQRGWGYLTGKGRSALGLDNATASAMQAETQQWVVDAMNAAWNRRADLAVPAQVRVKPLVWTGDGHWHSGDNEGWMEEANTPFGWGYAVEFGTLDTGPWKVSSTFGSDIVKFDTPSAAKAAAQADYEARILAAIEPQPAPRDEVIARLVGALENRLHDQECPCNACSPMLAALAAAKAVQHG